MYNLKMVQVIDGINLDSVLIVKVQVGEAIWENLWVVQVFQIEEVILFEALEVDPILVNINLD